MSKPHAFEQVVLIATNGRVGPDQLGALLADLHQLLGEDGLDKRIQVVAKTVAKPEQQREVLRAALIGYISGGDVEHDAMAKLASGFGLDRAVERALSICCSPEARVRETSARSAPAARKLRYATGLCLWTPTTRRAGPRAVDFAGTRARPLLGSADDEHEPEKTAGNGTVPEPFESARSHAASPVRTAARRRPYEFRSVRRSRDTWRHPRHDVVAPPTTARLIRAPTCT
jgi:hypothetical protein